MIEIAIEKFNRFHSPEVHAELVEKRNGEFVVKFTGKILWCTCGLYDYFEDLIWLSGLNAEIVEFKEGDDGYYVRYRLSTR